MAVQHIPVLLDLVLEALLPAERIIDGTIGVGGHAAALLKAGADAVLGLDRDLQALEIAYNTSLKRYRERVCLLHTSYAEMTAAAHSVEWYRVDGILLDLGVSSLQLDTPERGFAFKSDGPLDMRFDPTHNPETAADLVNTMSEKELAEIFFKYGEEPQGRRLAQAIVQRRPFETTGQLADLIERVAPRKKKEHLHPATRVFQALRIAVNDELGILERALPQAIDLLRPGGRLAVISFHSLEDRIVKHAFKLASTDCICPPKIPVCVCGHKASVRLLHRKPIMASEEEVGQNPRSRSAKLRVVEKLEV